MKNETNMKEGKMTTRWIMWDAKNKTWVVCGGASGQIKEYYSRTLNRWVMIP